MGTVTHLIGALPIREQPSGSPSTAIPEWLAFSIGLGLGLFLLAVIALLGRKRQRGQALQERRTWAAMNRLCDQGWTAQLTLYGGGAPLPDEAPEIDGIRVRIDWAELKDDGYGDREVAVARRFWSKSVSAALAALVHDRDLDRQLEEIERSHVGREPPSSSE